MLHAERAQEDVDGDGAVGDGHAVRAPGEARADGRPLLQPVDGVRALRDWFNDRQLGSYDGTPWRCWIARGGRVRAVDVTAKRLLW